MDDALPAWRSFAVALTCEASIALLSVKVSPRWFPARYATAPYSAKKKLWHTTAAALLPSVVVPLYAWPGLVRLVRERGPITQLLFEAPNSDLWRALGVSLAHFVFDFGVMAWYSADFIIAMRRPLYTQMLFHHAASVLCWPYAYARGKCVAPVAYFMLTEGCNAFLNTRWFFNECGITGAIRVLIDTAFFVSYTLVRVVPVFAALYLALHIDWLDYLRRCSTLDATLSALIVVPFGLNLFWYSLILKAASNAIYPKPALTNGDAKKAH